MVNKILYPVLSVSLSLAAPVAQAQETVRGIVCSIPQQCNLEESNMVYTLNPGVNNAGTFSDVNGEIDINVSCQTDAGLRLTGHQHTIVEQGWLSPEISKLSEGELTPYTMIHNESVGNDDFDCGMGDIEITSSIEDE